MNPIAKACLAASAAAFCAQASAQGMYKCKDAAGKITYAGSECQLLGLTPAGEDLRPVVMSLGIWGQRWVESSLSLKNLDPSLGAR